MPELECSSSCWCRLRTWVIRVIVVIVMDALIHRHHQPSPASPPIPFLNSLFYLLPILIPSLSSLSPSFSCPALLCRPYPAFPYTSLFISTLPPLSIFPSSFPFAPFVFSFPFLPPLLSPLFSFHVHFSASQFLSFLATPPPFTRGHASGRPGQ